MKSQEPAIKSEAASAELRQQDKEKPMAVIKDLKTGPGYKSFTQVMQKKPFDFQKVKVIIKRGKLDDYEIFLDKKWTLDHIEHFRPVIDGVTDDEGIEITLTCNLEAFQFIIKFLQETDYEKRFELVHEINHDNVLNILVTADFLKLDNIYEMAWHDYFLPQFNSIIDDC